MRTMSLSSALTSHEPHPAIDTDPFATGSSTAARITWESQQAIHAIYALAQCPLGDPPSPISPSTRSSPFFTVLQWIAVLAGLSGVGWLLAAALMPAFGQPPTEIPRVDGWAVPTLLIAAAALVGILLGPLAAAFGAATTASRRRRARRRLVIAVDAVLQRPVVEPVAADLNRARAFGTAQRRSPAPEGPGRGP